MGRTEFRFGKADGQNGIPFWMGRWALLSSVLGRQMGRTEFPFGMADKQNEIPFWMGRYL